MVIGGEGIEWNYRWSLALRVRHIGLPYAASSYLSDPFHSPQLGAPVGMDGTVPGASGEVVFVTAVGRIAGVGWEVRTWNAVLHRVCSGSYKQHSKKLRIRAGIVSEEWCVTDGPAPLWPWSEFELFFTSSHINQADSYSDYHSCVRATVWRMTRSRWSSIVVFLYWAQLMFNYMSLWFISGCSRALGIEVDLYQVE